MSPIQRWFLAVLVAIPGLAFAIMMGRQAYANNEFIRHLATIESVSSQKLMKVGTTYLFEGPILDAKTDLPNGLIAGCLQEVGVMSTGKKGGHGRLYWRVVRCESPSLTINSGGRSVVLRNHEHFEGPHTFPEGVELDQAHIGKQQWVGVVAGDWITAVARVEDLGPPVVAYASPVNDNLVVGTRAEMMRKKQEPEVFGIACMVFSAVLSVAAAVAVLFPRRSSS